jgi:hypothetical protein
VIILQVIVLFAVFAAAIAVLRRKFSQTAIHEDPLPKTPEPSISDPGQITITISSQVVKDSYYHDSKDDTYIETPHPNIKQKATSLPLPFKEGEQIVREGSTTKILKVPRYNNGLEERLDGNRRRFTYQCENLGAGRIILTNKSLFLLPDCTGKAIRIGLRAMGSPSQNEREDSALQIYKHDYHYPHNYRIYGVDVKEWWRSLKPNPLEKKA